MPEILPDQKADAAENDERHDDAVDPGVVGVAGERGERFPLPHQIEACIAEGGDSVEQTVPKPFREAEVPGKYRKQQKHSAELRAKGDAQQKTCPSDNPAHLGCGDGLLHHVSLGQADASAREAEEGDGHCDDAQTADLDQQKDHDLPEERPVRGRVMDHQPGHTGGGNRREQGVGKGGGGPVPAANGKGQNQGSQ